MVIFRMGEEMTTQDWVNLGLTAFLLALFSLVVWYTVNT